MDGAEFPRGLTGRTGRKAMNSLLHKGGQLIGLVGILLMAVSVVARLAGMFWVGGFSSGTLMQAGIGLVCVGCFGLLWVIVGRGAGRS
jgi:hypothetical protein